MSSGIRAWAMRARLSRARQVSTSAGSSQGRVRLPCDPARSNIYLTEVTKTVDNKEKRQRLNIPKQEPTCRKSLSWFPLGGLLRLVGLKTALPYKTTSRSRDRRGPNLQCSAASGPFEHYPSVLERAASLSLSFAKIAISTRRFS